MTNNTWRDDAPTMSDDFSHVFGEHDGARNEPHNIRTVWTDGTPVTGAAGEWRPCTDCLESILIEATEAAELACDEHGIPFEALVAYLDNEHNNITVWEEHIQECADAFRGAWDSVNEFADDLAHDIDFCRCNQHRDSRHWVNCYFDKAAFAYDLEASGDIWTAQAPNNQVFVFWGY